MFEDEVEADPNWKELFGLEIGELDLETDLDLFEKQAWVAKEETDRAQAELNSQATLPVKHELEVDLKSSAPVLTSGQPQEETLRENNRQEIVRLEKLVKQAKCKRDNYVFDRDKLNVMSNLHAIVNAAALVLPSLANAVAADKAHDLLKSLRDEIADRVMIKVAEQKRGRVEIAEEESAGFVRFHEDPSFMAGRFRSIESLAGRISQHKGQALFDTICILAELHVEVREEEVRVATKTSADEKEGRRVTVVHAKPPKAPIVEAVFVEKSGAVLGVYYLLLHLISPRLFAAVKRDLSSKHMTFFDSAKKELKVHFFPKNHKAIHPGSLLMSSRAAAAPANQALGEDVPHKASKEEYARLMYPANTSSPEEAVWRKQEEVLTDLWDLCRLEFRRIIQLLDDMLTNRPSLSRLSLSEVKSRAELHLLMPGVIALIMGLGRLLLLRLRRIAGVKVYLLRLQLDDDHFQTRMSISADNLTDLVVLDSPSSDHAYFSEALALMHSVYGDAFANMNVSMMLEGLCDPARKLRIATSGAEGSKRSVNKKVSQKKQSPVVLKPIPPPVSPTRLPGTIAGTTGQGTSSNHAAVERSSRKKDSRGRTDKSCKYQVTDPIKKEVTMEAKGSMRSSHAISRQDGNDNAMEQGSSSGIAASRPIIEPPNLRLSQSPSLEIVDDIPESLDDASEDEAAAAHSSQGSGGSRSGDEDRIEEEIEVETVEEVEAGRPFDRNGLRVPRLAEEQPNLARS